MPYPKLSEQEHFRNICLSTLITGAPGVVGAILYRKDIKSTIEWVENLRKPKWADWNTHVYQFLDLGTMLPLGYASYAVYRHGGGFNYSDTTFALAVYGANLSFMSYFIYAMVKKDLDQAVYAGIGHASTAAAVAVLFSKIHPRAGLLLLPYAIWSAVGTFFLSECRKDPLNKIKKALN